MKRGYRVNCHGWWQKQRMAREQGHHLISLDPSFFFLLPSFIESWVRRGSLTDHEMMELAVEEAPQASREGEVPLGAVLVRDGEVVARDHTRPISFNDPTTHAEILTDGSLLRLLQ